MRVLYEPKPHESGTGCTSFASWQNSDLKSAMEQLFQVKDNERLASIEIDRTGITARFERVSAKEEG